MPKFGKKSKSRLRTCDDELQSLFNEVVKYFDCSVLVGYRGRNEQNTAYESGHSQVEWPNGKHNKNPSVVLLKAVLFVWVYRFVGVVIGIMIPSYLIINLMILCTMNYQNEHKRYFKTGKFNYRIL